MDTVTTANGHHRRAELAAFLRSRRERITPEQAGLPPGSRRRTPGLRREEVAQLSGVGVTWYTWLEQGRQINASPQVLGAIARTLLLDQAEREHLFRLADLPDAATVAGAVPSGCEQVLPEVQEILDAVVPMPASVVNERFDLLAWNAPYQVLWPGVTGAAPGERNILWQCFTYPDCCHPYVNRHEQLAMLVAQLRGAYGRHLDGGVPAGRRGDQGGDHQAAGRGRRRGPLPLLGGPPAAQGRPGELSARPGRRAAPGGPGRRAAPRAQPVFCSPAATPLTASSSRRSSRSRSPEAAAPGPGTPRSPASARNCR